MKHSKTALAAFLAGAALLAGGAAAALELPTQAADKAREATADAAEAKAAGQAKADEAKAEATDDEVTETEATAEETAEEGTGERPTDTHGYEVSTLATTTELEGREKGEAISALARTNGGGTNSADDAETEGDTGKAKAKARSSK